MPPRPATRLAFPTRLALPTLLALAALVPACGDDPAPVDATPLCALYRAACERQAACGVYLYSNTADVDACLAELDCAGTAASMAAADVTISTADATACTAAITAASCAELAPWQDGRPASFITGTPACAATLVGGRAAGESCAASEQCQGDLTCQGQTCPGTCAVDASQCQRDACPADQFCGDGGCAPRADRGASCEIGDEFVNTCADGLFCAFDAALDGTCVDATPRGGACTVASYFVCAGGDACVDGTCQAPRATGATCATATDCGLGSFCDFDHGNVCAPWRAIGAACGTAFAECGLHGDCVDGTCQALRAPAPGPLLTRPTVGAGADCADANCAAGLACRPSGSDPANPLWRCAPAAALGASCEPPSEALRFALLFAGQRAVAACAQGVCDVLAPTWTCVAPQPPGAACPRDGLTAACTSLRCEAGRCADFFTCPS